jgi:hypothetical protein
VCVCVCVCVYVCVCVLVWEGGGSLAECVFNSVDVMRGGCVAPLRSHSQTSHSPTLAARTWSPRPALPTVGTQLLQQRSIRQSGRRVATAKP